MFPMLEDETIYANYSELQIFAKKITNDFVRKQIKRQLSNRNLIDEA